MFANQYGRVQGDMKALQQRLKDSLQSDREREDRRLAAMEAEKEELAKKRSEKQEMLVAGVEYEISNELPGESLFVEGSS